MSASRGISPGRRGSKKMSLSVHRVSPSSSIDSNPYSSSGLGGLDSEWITIEGGTSQLSGKNIARTVQASERRPPSLNLHAIGDLTNAMILMNPDEITEDQDPSSFEDKRRLQRTNSWASSQDSVSLVDDADNESESSGGSTHGEGGGSMDSISSDIPTTPLEVSQQFVPLSPSSWVPKNLVATCQLCNIAFSVTRKKHACRNCGQCICFKCGNTRHFFNNSKSKKDHRICSRCVESFSETPSLGRVPTLIGVVNYKKEKDDELSGDSLEPLVVRGLRFDGNGGYIHLSTSSVRTLSFPGRQPFTIETRVYPEKSDVPIIGKFNSGVKGEYKIFIDEECCLRAYREAPPHYWICSEKKISLNTWYHIALVYDGNTLAILVNGDVWGSGESGDAVQEAVDNTAVHIGTWYRNGKIGKTFKGLMSDVKFWKIARTSENIKQSLLYNESMDNEIDNDNSNFDVDDLESEEDLIGHWSLTEGVGRCIFDQSSKKNHGYFLGDTKGIFHLENTLNFDGVGGFIQLPVAASLLLSFGGLQPFSFEVWVNPALSDVPIIGKFNTRVSGEYKIYIDRNYYVHFYREAAPFKHLVASECVLPGRFTHICCTYDGHSQRIFLNGVCYGQMSSAACVTDPQTLVHIGTWKKQGQLGQMFRGTMRELRFWNKALTKIEIFNLMSKPPPVNHPNLLGYWPLSEGSGRIIFDKGPNVIHGFVVGAAGWVKMSPSVLIDLNPCRTPRVASRVLVTGGAGFIGSHVCVELVLAGYEVSVIDNYDNSCVESLKRVVDITGKPLSYHRVDLLDAVAVESVFCGTKYDAVVHIAGLKSVGMSSQTPLTYYHNNITGTLNLLRVMARYKCKNLVFSSSATVYGSPPTLPITEDMPIGLSCTNPYAKTKYFIEEMIGDLYKSDRSWNIVTLRYFNPVGAHPSGLIGEDPSGIPNNLFPFVTQVAVGKLARVDIFGSDWDTPDGTGVRDYVHIVDLARGHLKALERLSKKAGLDIYNLGTGVGYSVLEVIQGVERSCGHPIPYQFRPRREGDLGCLYADPSKAAKELGWRAELGLDDMCADSWRWQSMNPTGYRSNQPLFVDKEDL